MGTSDRDEEDHFYLHVINLQQNISVIDYIHLKNNSKMFNSNVTPSK